MGLFNRKKIGVNKLFTAEEMLGILRQEEYKDYTSECIETTKGTKYKLITIEESRRKEQEIRKRQIENNSFKERITGGGEYRNINTRTIYNDYQSSKGYIGNIMCK